MRTTLDYDDDMTARATWEAESRYRVRGEVRWTRRDSGFDLPQDPKVVRSTKYEAAAFRDSGEIFLVNAFVTTGFATVVLVRMLENAVRLTVWGDDRRSVAQTVRAFLVAWPPEGAGANSELLSGQYL